MAGFQRLLHLFAVGVVFHARLLRLTVEQHRAVGGDPGYTAAVDVHIIEIIRAGGLDALRGKVGLHVELIHLLV